MTPYILWIVGILGLGFATALSDIAQQSIYLEALFQLLGTK